jgi:transcription antitermination factor NusG
MNNNKIGEDALRKAAELETRRGALKRAAETATRTWHLVQIAPRAYPLAQQHLTGAGYEVYSPLLRTLVVPRTNQLSAAQRRHRHMLAREKLSPFLGSYRFVQLDLDCDPWHDIFRLVGVRGIVCMNNCPAPMPPDYVARLKEKETNGAIDGLTPMFDLLPADPQAVAALEAARPLRAGENGRVTHGPLVSFEGPVEKVDESGRISLVLSFFGGVQSVEFDIDQVERVPPH